VAAHVAGTRNAEEKIDYVVTGTVIVLLISVIATIIAEIVFLYSGLWEGELRWTLATFFIILPITALLWLTTTILQAAGKYRQFAVFTVLGGLVPLIVVAPMAAFYDLEGWVLGRFLSGLGIVVVGGYYVSPYLRIRKPKLAAARELFLFSRVQVFSGLMSNLMQWVDVIALERLSGDMRQVGVYGVAKLFSQFVMFIPGAIGGVFFKRLAEAAQDLPEAWRLERAFLLVIVAACGSVALGLYFFAAPGLSYLYGDDYAESIPILRILCLGIVPGGLCMGLAVFNTSTKRPKNNVVISTCGAVVCVIAVFALVPGYGALGAAWAVVAANVSGALTGFVLLWKVIRG
jgi:O-antigen/teichoic acid export membrane protein